MSQNVVSLALSAEQVEAVNKALDVLEKNLEGLISLSVEDRSQLLKMGSKSEMFARKAHEVLAQSPEILPATFQLMRSNGSTPEEFFRKSHLRPPFLHQDADKLR